MHVHDAQRVLERTNTHSIKKSVVFIRESRHFVFKFIKFERFSSVYSHGRSSRKQFVYNMLVLYTYYALILNLCTICLFTLSTEPVLHDMASAFFGAGSETVRQSVEWLTLMSATNQKAQRRVQDEINEVIGPDRLPTWLDHNKMPYTDAFIMEMMRWMTLAPINLIRW